MTQTLVKFGEIDVGLTVGGYQTGTYNTAHWREFRDSLNLQGYLTVHNGVPADRPAVTEGSESDITTSERILTNIMTRHSGAWQRLASH